MSQKWASLTIHSLYCETDVVITLTSPNHDIITQVFPEFGSRLGSLVINGQQILVTKQNDDDPLSWGCYPMVPFAGRLRHGQLHFNNETHQLRLNDHPHAIHGTVFNQTWDIRQQTSSSITVETHFGLHWPFNGSVQHHIKVTDNHIHFGLAVTAQETMPVQVGWHPWFVKPQSSSLHFGSMLQRDPQGITTAQQVEPPQSVVDDCFVMPQGDLTVTVNNQQLMLTSDCSHWVVFDKPEHATCVEPQSGAPNAINDSPSVLIAGETFRRWFCIDVVHGRQRQQLASTQ